MPVPVFLPKTVKCVKCGEKFKVMLGDVKPQTAECPRCKFVNIIVK